jgi:hypothetical protein
MRSFESSSTGILPRSPRDYFKGLLLAGIPSTFVLGLLMSGEPVSNTKSAATIHTDTRAASRNVLGVVKDPTTNMVSNSDDSLVAPVDVNDSPVRQEFPRGSQPTSFQQASNRGRNASDTERNDVPLQDDIAELERQLQKEKLDGHKITQLLDKLAWKVASSSVSSDVLKPLLKQVLEHVQGPRGRWNGDNESALVLQGTVGLLARTYSKNEQGKLQSLQNPPLLSEDEYRQFQEKIEFERRFQLATLAQSRIQELLSIVSPDPETRYDAVYGSFLLADSVNLVQLLQANGGRSEFLAAKADVERLLIDMLSDFHRKPGKEANVQRIESILTQIRAIL